MGPHGRGRADAACVGVAPGCVEGVAPRIDAPIGAARRHLPLRLGRQPPRLAGHFRQPAHVGQRVLPVDTDHRMVEVLELLRPRPVHAGMYPGRLAHAPGAHSAGVLGHRHRVLANREVAHQHGILRHFVVPGVCVARLVAAHREGARGNRAERRHDAVDHIAAEAERVERGGRQVRHGLSAVRRGRGGRT